MRWQELPTAVLVAKLRRGRAVLRWEAAKALSGKRGCVPQLLREVGKEQDDAVRQMLLYAIAHSHDERALDTLSRLLADRGETPDIRGQCAEGLAYILLPMDRRRSGYKAAIRTLMDALDDPSPIVRFWSIFALGSAGARPALPKLRALARSDRARVEGWWRVKDEAADAIEALETGNWPDRERRPAE